jgi:hypothetical protein
MEQKSEKTEETDKIVLIKHKYYPLKTAKVHLILFSPVSTLLVHLSEVKKPDNQLIIRLLAYPEPVLTSPKSAKSIKSKTAYIYLIYR